MYINEIHIYMEDRIRKFMEYKGISASELADSIGVQRSNVTHVLKARNKPSFQFIEKLLQVYPELNAKWLMLGIGNMVETSPTKPLTLFDQMTGSVTPSVPKAEKQVEKTEEKIREEKTIVREEVPVETKVNSSAPITEKVRDNDELQNQFFSSEKPIERLIVFFKDQTFKVYNPSR